jgi:polyhydroxyalkanoate synthase
MAEVASTSATRRRSRPFPLRVLRTLGLLTQIRQEDVDVGTAPKELVYRDGRLTLHRYLPVTAQRVRTPLLIVYSLANRYYMMDLQDDRSLIRGLLREGVDVYLIDWGYPRSQDRWLSFDDYVNGYIADCAEVVRRRSGAPTVNVLGVCMGGLLSLCFAALHSEKVGALVTMGTAVDYHADEPIINRWSHSIDIDRLVSAFGNVPGELINLGFFMRSPFQRNLRKYIDMLDAFETREGALNFLRMERWTYDSPDQAGEAYRQWAKDCCQENRLIRGELRVGDRRVDLGDVTMPVLNIYAEKDDLVPPAASKALQRYVGSRDYRELSYPAGHIGLYVSGKVQRDLPRQIAGWLAEHDTT